MSDLDEKKLYDITVIEQIKRLIKITTEKSRENYEISTKTISNVHVNHIQDDHGNVIALKVKSLNTLEIDDYNLNILNKDIQDLLSTLVNLRSLYLTGNGISHIISGLNI